MKRYDLTSIESKQVIQLIDNEIKRLTIEINVYSALIETSKGLSKINIERNIENNDLKIDSLKSLKETFSRGKNNG